MAGMGLWLAWDYGWHGIMACMLLSTDDGCGRDVGHVIYEFVIFLSF